MKSSIISKSITSNKSTTKYIIYTSTISKINNKDLITMSDSNKKTQIQITKSTLRILKLIKGLEPKYDNYDQLVLHLAEIHQKHWLFEVIHNNMLL